jgi:hypothetical protein
MKKVYESIFTSCLSKSRLRVILTLEIKVEYFLSLSDREFSLEGIKEMEL